MRLHPLSIPYRSVESGLPLAFTLLFLAPTVGGPFVLPLVVLLVAAVVGYQIAVYRRFDYELTPETFDIRSGVLSRRTREIPLRRIQTVDISQNVVQRALDVAAVDFETAGGSGTEASLRFVSYEEAKRLQREIPRLKRASDEPGAGDEGTAEEAEAELLFELSDRELALVSLLSFDFRASGLVAFVATGSLSAVPFALPFESELRALLLSFGIVVLAVAAILLSWFVSALVAFTNYYGFRLERTADDLEYERGLLKRYTGSIPRDKIQTLVITDDPLQRRFGYASLSVETAGYSPGGEESRGLEAAVPLATRARVSSLARTLEPFAEPAFERPPKRVRRRYAGRYLTVLGLAVAVLFLAESTVAATYPWYAPLAPLVLLPLVPVAAHYKWLSRGYWLGDDHVITRNGFWRRRVHVVPYYRIQTVIDGRTIFQRRLDLATVTVDTAGSRAVLGGDAAAVDVASGTADDLRRALSERLRTALAARKRR